MHCGFMKIVARALWAVLLGGSALVVASSWPYLLPGLRHPFLLERLVQSLDAVWLVTLKVHVACELACLPTGLLLLSRRGRERWPRFHRIVGRGYASVVLFVMVPTGVYLAPYSKLGWASGSGFALSAVVLFATTLDSIQAARRGDAQHHRVAALHSFAQVASAISFRIYHLAFQLLDLPYETNYIASVWLSVIGNAVLAELWIRHTYERSHHETSTRNERSVFGVLAER